MRQEENNQLIPANSLPVSRRTVIVKEVDNRLTTQTTFVLEPMTITKLFQGKDTTEMVVVGLKEEIGEVLFKLTRDPQAKEVVHCEAVLLS